MNTSAIVELWGTEVGAAIWDDERHVGVFQYTPDLLALNIEIAPLMMPLRPDPYDFVGLREETFKGLPGLLADSLPDKFGNRLINAWLAEQGRKPASMNPIERLCYIGRRGMGALEFKPGIKGARNRADKALEISHLVDLAGRVLSDRMGLSGDLGGGEEQDKAALEDILLVGTSAGGARAKALLAYNDKTGAFLSGQVSAPAGFEYWLMKFDGVDRNGDKELADPKGYGLIEYAYYLMATAAGIIMSPCRVYEENGRSHFMTQRFDRAAKTGDKIHMQSLTAMRHFDFNDPSAYSYEQAIETCEMLGLEAFDKEQQFRRAVFNIVARNQDDHTKNIAFLMDRAGEWSLSPAFDVTYSYNPAGDWTSRHQMSVNGKRDNFSRDDLVALGRRAGLTSRRSNAIIKEIVEVVSNWATYAGEAGIKEGTAKSIRNAHRLAFNGDRRP